MKIQRIVGIALAGALAVGGLAVSGNSADAAIGDTDPLIQCDEPGSGTIGSVKFSPGLKTTNAKNSISGTITTLGTCSADESDLDEIASGSKFGVTKTAAGGRLAITGGNAKVKFSAYGDCLGIVIPDGDETNEYPATYGTIQVQFMNGATKLPVKSTIFATLEASAAGANVVGLVTKGAGVGGDATLTAGFAPVAADDTNANASPDFIDCALFGDPTAVAKLLDVVGPASLDITL